MKIDLRMKMLICSLIDGMGHVLSQVSTDVFYIRIRFLFHDLFKIFVWYQGWIFWPLLFLWKNVEKMFLFHYICVFCRAILCIESGLVVAKVKTHDE